MWKSRLETWSISYVYGELPISDDALDSCTDEEAQPWFNKNVQRYSDGVDRVTCTKRLGRSDGGTLESRNSNTIAGVLENEEMVSLEGLRGRP